MNLQKKKKTICIYNSQRCLHILISTKTLISLKFVRKGSQNLLRWLRLILVSINQSQIFLSLLAIKYQHKMFLT